jgi:hypothetical protein
MRILICQIDFLIPARKLLVDYSYTAQRQLPLISEYILRIVYIMDRLSVSELESYFGLSSYESDIVLRELHGQGLIDINDNGIRLSEYSYLRFAEADGDTSRFFEYKDASALFGIELLSDTILPSGTYIRNRSFGHAIESDQSLENFRERAIDAFSKGFHYFLGEYGKGDRVSNNQELYKVSALTIQDDGFATSRINVEIDTRNLRLYTSHDQAKDLEALFSSHLMTEVNKFLFSGEKPDLEYTNHLKAHNHSFKDPFLTRYTLKDSRFDLVAALAAYEKWLSPEDKSILVVGPMASWENLSRIRSLAETSDAFLENEAKELDDPKSISILNEIPSLWGRSESYRDFDQSFRRPSFTLVSPSSQLYRASDIKSHLHSMSRNPVAQATCFVSPLTEIYLLPGLLGIVQFHFPCAETSRVTIPIGFATTDTVRLALVAEKLRSWLAVGKKISTTLAAGRDSGSRDVEQTRNEIISILS